MIQQRGNRPPSGSVIVAGILIFILAVVTVVSFFTVFQFEDAVTEQAISPWRPISTKTCRTSSATGTSCSRCCAT